MEPREPHRSLPGRADLVSSDRGSPAPGHDSSLNSCLAWSPNDGFAQLFLLQRSTRPEIAKSKPPVPGRPYVWGVGSSSLRHLVGGDTRSAQLGGLST